MTTSLEAMKAAREALRLTVLQVKALEGAFGFHRPACVGEAESTLTLLDAAIQREEGGGEAKDKALEAAAKALDIAQEAVAVDFDWVAQECRSALALVIEAQGGGGAPSFRCVVCGTRVEKARECYAIPHCYACLPPPPPLTPVPPSGVVSREALETPTSDELVRRFHEMPSCPHADPDVPRWHQVGHEHSGDVFCSLCIGNLLACAYEDGQESAAALSAPSEPMVPRARAMEAILDALTFDARWPDEAKDLFDRWRRETADRIAARILDGEASDGE